MTTLMRDKPTSSPAAGFFDNRKRWTRAECALLERVGLLNERYELLNGEIIDKMGQNRSHIMVSTRVFGWLIAVFGLERVQSQGDIEVAPVDQPSNRPQPDAAVLVQPDYSYDEPPRGTDLLLVVEVSDATLRDDLTVKAALYARAGISEYWVLDAPSRRLIVHRAPIAGTYTGVVALADTDRAETLAAPGQFVSVADLLAPAATLESA